MGGQPSPPSPHPGSTSAYTLKDPGVTPSGGGSYGGLPPNASRQPQVNPKDILNYNLKNRSGVSGTNIPSASGGDAGAASRQRLLTKSPKLPQWMQDFRRGAEAGRAKVTSKIPAAAYFIPGVRQLATSATIGATIGGALGEIGRAEIDRKIKKLPTTKTKTGTTITYVPPDKDGNFNARMYPDAIKQLTKAQVKALTPAQKYMTQAQYDKSIAGTDLEIKTATTKQPETETQTQIQAPSTTKTKVDTKDPIPKPNDQKIDPNLVGAGSLAASGLTRRGDTKNRNDKKPKFGVPSQARGKIGRRQNPQ